MPVEILADERAVDDCYAPVCWLSGYSAVNSLYSAFDQYLMSAIHHRRPRSMPLDTPAVDWLDYPFEDYDYELLSKQVVLIGPVDDNLAPVTDLPEDVCNGEVQLPNIVCLDTYGPPEQIQRDLGPGELNYTCEEHEYIVNEEAVMTAVNEFALRVVQLAAPSLTVARLWRVWWTSIHKSPLRREQVLEGIDYGPIPDFERSDSLLHWWGDDPVFDAWILDFMRKGAAPTEADQRMLMFGRGHLYVVVPPHLFPTSEATRLSRESCLDRIASAGIKSSLSATNSPALTLANVPADILHLIAAQVELKSLLSFMGSCRYILQTLFPVANTIIRRRMLEYERWYYPLDAHHPYPWEDERNDKWLIMQQWADTVLASASSQSQETNTARDRIEATEGPFPWLFYAQACIRSPAMENRKRIWHVGEQIEALADRWGVPRV